jgi:hypothetical protein
MKVVTATRSSAWFVTELRMTKLIDVDFEINLLGAKPSSSPLEFSNLSGDDVMAGTPPCVTSFILVRQSVPFLRIVSDVK